MSIFHEPWSDEAVAWQIAKCASVKDIIFTLPHYEGHPPLWHLILLPFAKLGCPYEFSLSLVSCVFSGLAMALLIFKSPFPRIIRLLLPFTYFTFYQFGVVSRPYCIMMLAFVLAAMTYQNRNTKPWRFVLSLMLLCLTSAYGILIAGGITIAWLIELFKEEKFRLLLNKRRTLSLLCLLILAILLILEVFPAESNYSENRQSIPNENSLLLKLLYMLIILPADTCITDIYSYDIILMYASFSPVSIVFGVWIGILVWTALIYISKRKGNTLTLVIPYCLFAVFAALKYMWLHHVGVPLLFFIFWAWISCSSNISDAKPMKEEIGEIGVSMLRLFGSAALILSLYWGISASVNEFLYAYSIGRYEAEFIKENNLDDYNIMVGYSNYFDFDDEGNMTTERIGSDFNHCRFPDPVLAYFDRNIFFNFNNGEDDKAYTFHKIANEEDCAEQIQKWREQGPPDVIYMPPLGGEIGFGNYENVDMTAVYDGITDISDYRLVYFHPVKQIWKNTSSNRYAEIYVRKDLADELGLEYPDL